MKKKVGTLLDSDLVAKVKLLAAREGKTINYVLEEALDLYLKGKETVLKGRKSHMVDETWGVFRVKNGDLKIVMKDENWYEI